MSLVRNNFLRSKSHCAGLLDSSKVVLRDEQGQQVQACGLIRHLLLADKIGEVRKIIKDQLLVCRQKAPPKDVWPLLDTLYFLSLVRTKESLPNLLNFCESHMAKHSRFTTGKSAKIPIISPKEPHKIKLKPIEYVQVLFCGSQMGQNQDKQALMTAYLLSQAQKRILIDQIISLLHQSKSFFLYLIFKPES